MPYVLWKKNGKRCSTPFVFTESEVDNLAKDTSNRYVLVNTTTRRMRKVGGKRRGYGRRKRAYKGR